MSLLQQDFREEPTKSPASPGFLLHDEVNSQLAGAYRTVTNHSRPDWL
jgi:hypothetical protein